MLPARNNSCVAAAAAAVDQEATHRNPRMNANGMKLLQ